MQRSQTQRKTCAFDGKCKNPQCTYVHYDLSANREICRFGAECTNKGCWRFHTCQKLPPPRKATLSAMTPEEADLFLMCMTMRMEDATNEAEARLVRVLNTIKQAADVEVGVSIDEEVEQAFEEFLDTTDTEQQLDDYAADELEALEELEQEF
jgi:hypothetical protein